MLKILKKCLHHQKNVVIYKLGTPGNIQLIAFWTCVFQILMHNPTFNGNRKHLVRSPQRRHFSPFVVSCDGELGNEAKILWFIQLHKTLPQASPRNQESPAYSETRMSIALLLYEASHTSLFCFTHPRDEPDEPTSFPVIR